MMNEIVQTKLSELIKRFGTSLSEDPSKLRAVLNDTLQNEYKKEINLLLLGVEEKVTEELNKGNTPTVILIPMLVERLINNRGLEKSNAEWVVETWAFALGVNYSETELKNLEQPFIQDISSQDIKECPYCAEIIKVKAKKCRFCNSDLEENVGNVIDNQNSAKPKENIELTSNSRNDPYIFTNKYGEFSKPFDRENLNLELKELISKGRFEKALQLIDKLDFMDSKLSTLRNNIINQDKDLLERVEYELNDLYENIIPSLLEDKNYSKAFSILKDFAKSKYNIYEPDKSNNYKFVFSSLISECQDIIAKPHLSNFINTNISKLKVEINKLLQVNRYAQALKKIDSMENFFSSHFDRSSIFINDLFIDHPYYYFNSNNYDYSPFKQTFNFLKEEVNREKIKFENNRKTTNISQIRFTSRNGIKKELRVRTFFIVLFFFILVSYLSTLRIFILYPNKRDQEYSKDTEVVKYLNIWENLFKDGGKYCYVNKSGTIIIQQQFDDAEPFLEGLAAVKLNDKWGFIDKTGEIVIKPKFDFAYRFSEGLAAVKLNDKWGYINKSSKIIIPIKFDDSYERTGGIYDPNFRSGHASVHINGKWLEINSSGKFIDL